MGDQLSSDLASLRLRRSDPARRSPWPKRIVTLLVVGGAAGAAWLVGVPRLESKLFKTEVAATEILSVSPAQASVTLTSSGYVVAQRSSDVGPVVAGRIKRIDIKEGDTVKLGQVIALLENADRKTALSAAHSQVQTAEARAQVARADLQALELKAKRERALAKEGVSASSIADDLDAQVEAGKKQVQAAESQIKASKAEASSLRVNLDYMTVTAPIDGMVVGKPVGVGAMVGPFVGAIAKLVDLASLVVETDVPEGRIHLLTKNGPAEILLDAFPGKRLRGEVAEIGPRVDRAKATVTVKVKFADGTQGVLPDMAARVNFLTQKIDEQALKEPAKVVVPSAAVAERSGAKVVFVLDAGKVRMRTITLGKPLGNGFELVDGPPVGTRVVRDPPPALTDGKEVKEAGGT